MTCEHIEFLKNNVLVKFRIHSTEQLKLDALICPWCPKEDKKCMHDGQDWWVCLHNYPYTVPKLNSPNCPFCPSEKPEANEEYPCICGKPGGASAHRSEHMTKPEPPKEETEHSYCGCAVLCDGYTRKQPQDKSVKERLAEKLIESYCTNATVFDKHKLAEVAIEFFRSDILSRISEEEIANILCSTHKSAGCADLDIVKATLIMQYLQRKVNEC